MHVLSLNCCGLVQKLNYPEFKDLILDYDFICLQETKTDDVDEIELEGYKFVMKNRRKYGRIKSGGIAFAYREEYERYISVHESESKFILWVEISKELTKQEENLFIGVVYIPPESSRYSSRDAFNEIEDEILEIMVRNKFVLLAGDFNSRTGDCADFHDPNDFSNEFSSDIFGDLHFDLLNLSDYGISQCRKNSDSNVFGKLILQMCKSMNLFIAIG